MWFHTIPLLDITVNVRMQKQTPTINKRPVKEPFCSSKKKPVCFSQRSGGDEGTFPCLTSHSFNKRLNLDPLAPSSDSTHWIPIPIISRANVSQCSLRRTSKKKRKSLISFQVAGPLVNGSRKQNTGSILFTKGRVVQTSWMDMWVM